MGTLSNAFEKSITLTSVCPPLCISLAKSSTNVNLLAGSEGDGSFKVLTYNRALLEQRNNSLCIMSLMRVPGSWFIQS